jgi:hypothetical protein
MSKENNKRFVFSNGSTYVKFVATCDLLEDGQILVTRWREDHWKEDCTVTQKHTIILDGYNFDDSLQAFVLPGPDVVQVRGASIVPYIAALMANKKAYSAHLREQGRR